MVSKRRTHAQSCVYKETAVMHGPGCPIDTTFRYNMDLEYMECMKNVSLRGEIGTLAHGIRSLVLYLELRDVEVKLRKKIFSFSPETF